MRRTDLLPVFLEEAGRHLDDAKALLATSPLLEESIPDLFRHLHSIKGMAASLGLDELMRVAHGAEATVDELRDAPEDTDLVARLDGGIGRLTDLLAALGSGPPVASPVGVPHAAPLRADLPQVRLDQDRLDRLIEISLRLSASQQRLEHYLDLPDDPSLASLRDALGESVRALQREVLELRLLPVRGLVPVLETALRRWARERGHRVALAVSGDAIQVDRAILERLLDPLGNLLRNAAAHGFEGARERAAAGKPERNRVEIAVRREGEDLVLVVADDGRGIDPSVVLRRARERGIPGAETVREADALELLTSPGMSSRSAAEPLAGRGIGLASVRRDIEQLGGRLRLDSAPGEGLSATIRLPARVSLLDVFVVIAGSQAFAIPVSRVREAREVRRRGAEEPPGIIADLATCLDLEPLTDPGERTCLVLDQAAPLVALTVDRVLGRREVVVRPLGPPLDQASLFSGAVVLPEGGLALLIDPARVARTLAVSARMSP